MPNKDIDFFPAKTASDPPPQYLQVPYADVWWHMQNACQCCVRTVSTTRKGKTVDSVLAGSTAMPVTVQSMTVSHARVLSQLRQTSE